jgi:hypothetical protein
MNFFSKKYMIAVYVALGLLLLFGVIHLISSKRNYEQIYGASFNAEYAAYLGFEPMDVFTTMLDDWGFRRIRLSAQWEEIEQSPGIYDFSELNKFMDEAEKRGAKVILTIGQKIPRWPECHPPAWAVGLSDNEYKAAVKRLVKVSVEQYKDHPSLEIWQVENEPLLAFGECRFFGKEMLAEEIAMVRQIDPEHKIMITDSGELSSWRDTAKAGDLFGTTMYRVVWHKKLGYISYNWISPLFYRAKLWLTGQKPENTYICELQAEPWIPDSNVKELDLSEQYKSMNPQLFKQSVDYARRVGFPRAYLWGAEWWYYMEKSRGVSDFADYARTLKKE